ncbi:MAG: hypothetical protein EA397_13770 [Deltaproteobacteria bacterium]|nr:MAG: hypothetical protein EA397_13770 [Deltaproteobacteria bacterium]
MDLLSISLMLATGSLGLGSLTALLVLGSRAKRREREKDEANAALVDDLRSLKNALSVTRAELDKRHDAATELSQRLKRLEPEVADLRLELEELRPIRAEAEALRSSQAELREALHQRDQRIDSLTARSQQLNRDKERLGVEIDAARRRFTDATELQRRAFDERLREERHQRRRLEVVLDALDLEISGDVSDPLAPEARRGSSEHLTDLLTSTTCTAAAIVDDRGHSLLAVGPTDEIARLGRLAAIGAQAMSSLEQTLRMPIRSLTAMLTSSGLHLHRLGPDDGRWVGVYGPVETPDLALRITTARMVGELPSLPPPSAPLSLEPPADATGEDADRTFLADWTSRWKAMACVLLDEEDEVLSASDPGWSEDFRDLSAFLRTWFRRLDRDGEDLGAAALRIGSYAGGWLSARVVEDDPDGLIIIAMSDIALPPEALDELGGAARWHRLVSSSTLTTREASA